MRGVARRGGIGVSLPHEGGDPTTRSLGCSLVLYTHLRGVWKERLLLARYGAGPPSTTRPQKQRSRAATNPNALKAHEYDYRYQKIPLSPCVLYPVARAR